MEIRKINLLLEAGAGGAGGGGTSTISACLNTMNSVISSLDSIKGELTSSVLSDSNYAVSKLSEKVINAANELQRAHAKLKLANSKMNTNKVNIQ